MKKCSKCGSLKSLDEFYNSSDKYKMSQCKECFLAYKKQYRLDNLEKVTDQSKKSYYNNQEYRVSEAQKWRDKNPKHIKEYTKRVSRKRIVGRYGITEKDYNNILKEQNGVCAICGEPETKKLKGKVRHLSVDHCHKTNIVRGLLCDKCNNGLGRFEDNIDVMASAISYLQQK